MSAAYGVPLGGALFALEVMRGVLGLRYVLPALFASLVATGVSWLALPDAPDLRHPRLLQLPPGAGRGAGDGPRGGLPLGGLRAAGPLGRPAPAARVAAAGRAGPGAGRAGRRVHRASPSSWGTAGTSRSSPSPTRSRPALLLALLLLKPVATVLCVRSGAPGGLFTPSLTVGAMLGGVLGQAWVRLWPGVPPGLFALLGAGAVLAATTQGPISTVVLLMELTGRDRSFILPLLLRGGHGHAGGAEHRVPVHLRGAPRGRGGRRQAEPARGAYLTRSRAATRTPARGAARADPRPRHGAGGTRPRWPWS